MTYAKPVVSGSLQQCELWDELPFDTAVPDISCGAQHLVCFPKVLACCKPYVFTFLRCKVTFNYIEVSVQK